ncbi:MAG: amidohydrolase family protein [Actinomycetota bacterium]|nr:amidohydrolase family protein [Actinomycetota bacterium]
MHDLVIRRGTLVDGTGEPRRLADVAIDDGVITGVGSVDGRGRREIDADGLLVTPGWVDIHTHYDGQATWDPLITPSSLHGVTSVVMGNCGVGFAPARSGASDHDALIALMEGVEDIPGAALSEGITWEWESIPEYLDALERRPHAVDLGAQVPHAALRAYVMGERGADHTAEPSGREIADMARLVAEGLAAGALGFASSRTLNHRSRDGRRIGTLTAGEAELVGIAEALGFADTGVLQFVSDFGDVDAELGLLRRVAERAGRPLSVSLVQVDHQPERWREVLAHIERANAEGVDIKAQVAVRTVGLLIGLHGSMHPFVKTPSYAPLADLPVDEQARRMRDPELRRRLLAEAGDVRGGLFEYVARRMDKIFPLGDPPDYEPPAERSIAARAARTGRSPLEELYDVLVDGAGSDLLYCPAGNYAGYDLEVVREMALSPFTLSGLSDGGAHCAFICDASFPTFALAHWCRDRTRGPQLPLEHMVRRQTADTARHVGWHDRGVVAPGYLADLNVIDLDALALAPPRMVHDLPADGRRLMQGASGYRATIKSGVVTFEDGVHTDELPGTLVRGARPAPVAATAAR